MKTLIKLVILTLCTASLKAHALVDLRATYGLITAQDQSAEACGVYCTTPTPSVVPFGGIGFDLIVSPPLMSWGFGVRYEDMALKASSSSIEVDAGIKRISLIVNYRLIDTILHLGPIFTYGLSTKSHMKITEGGTTRVDYSSSAADSISAGLELGVKPLIVVPLVIGAEAGYNMLKIKDATDSVNSESKDLDFNGIYFKVFAGISF